MFYLVLFLLGLAVGSFLNSVIYRLGTSESIFLDRSSCPKCKKILAWYDLVPLVSFIFLGGRCRSCHRRISWQYPLVEITTGILFVLLVHKFSIFNSQFSLNFQFSIFNYLYWLFIGSSLIVIFIYDLKHFIIPDKIVYPAIAVVFLYNLFSSLCSGRVYSALSFLSEPESERDLTLLYSELFAVLIGGGFFLLLVAISKGKWIGMGDVKLAVLMGLILGWPKILVALMLAFFSGAAIGLILIAGGVKTMKSQVPFGPFLIGGTLIAIFYGEKLIGWYLNFFN